MNNILFSQIMNTTYNSTYISSQIIPNSMSTIRGEYNRSDYGFQCIEQNINCGAHRLFISHLSNAEIEHLINFTSVFVSHTT